MVATSCTDSESLPHRGPQYMRYQIKGLTLGKSYWLSYCWPEVKTTFHVIWNDVLRVAISLLFHWKVSIYNLGMIGVIVALSIGLSCLLAYEPYNYTPCVPGGDFSLFLEYDRFAMRRAFQITLGFGYLTFAQVKLIDIVWDVVVGRGGQGVLAIISYRVFSKCLTRLVEREHLSATYRLYEAIVFRGASLQLIWQLCTSFTKNMQSQDLAAICWIILASAYVVVFPTWVSAMTGYSSNVSPSFKTYSGSIVPWQGSRVLYNIHDGDRIGKTVDYLVGMVRPNDDYYHDDGDNVYYSCLYEIDVAKQYGAYGGDSVYQPCYFANSTSNYVANHGSNMAYNKSSVFNGTQLSAPTLNITAYSTSFVRKHYDEYEYPRFSIGRESVEADLPVMYSVAGKAYELQDILHHRASCVNQSDYQWGFSFLLLFLFLIVTIVWTLGMCVMYQDAYWNSRLDRIPRNLGLFRGVADVNKALKIDGIAPSDLASENQIRLLLNEREGAITFANLDTTGMLSRLAELRAWAKDTPSLSEWLEPWTILQWTWLFILVLIGLPFCNYFIDQMIMPLPWWLCCILLFCGLCSTITRLVRRHRGQHRHVKFRSWLPTRF